MGVGDLSSNYLIGLPILKPTLGVANNDPVDLEILELLGSNLSGICSLTGLTHVLTSDLDVVPGECLDSRNMNADRCNHDLKLARVVLQFVQMVVDEIFH